MPEFKDGKFVPTANEMATQPKKWMRTASEMNAELQENVPTKSKKHSGRIFFFIVGSVIAIVLCIFSEPIPPRPLATLEITDSSNFTNTLPEGTPAPMQSLQRQPIPTYNPNLPYPYSVLPAQAPEDFIPPVMNPGPGERVFEDSCGGIKFVMLIADPTLPDPLPKDNRNCLDWQNQGYTWYWPNAVYGDLHIHFEAMNGEGGIFNIANKQNVQMVRIGTTDEWWGQKNNIWFHIYRDPNGLTVNPTLQAWGLESEDPILAGMRVDDCAGIEYSVTPIEGVTFLTTDCEGAWLWLYIETGSGDGVYMYAVYQEGITMKVNQYQCGNLGPTCNTQEISNEHGMYTATSWRGNGPFTLQFDAREGGTIPENPVSTGDKHPLLPPNPLPIVNGQIHFFADEMFTRRSYPVPNTDGICRTDAPYDSENWIRIEGEFSFFNFRVIETGWYDTARLEEFKDEFELEGFTKYPGVNYFRAGGVEGHTVVLLRCSQVFVTWVQLWNSVDYLDGEVYVFQEWWKK